jgi:hypothetical protein
MGSFLLIWFKAPDIEKAFTRLATSGEEFTIWFRGQVKDVTGVDLGAPPESSPPPHWLTAPPKEHPPPVWMSPAARGPPGRRPPPYVPSAGPRHHQSAWEGRPRTPGWPHKTAAGCRSIEHAESASFGAN